ncbi:MAG: Nudix family hydrolase [Gammaproteobacteria bacterium]
MSRQADLKLIDVVVGVITDGQDRVLIQQRTDGPFAGQWEFPGGKRERGESSFEALRRELHEENGITVERASPLIHITHRYPDRAVSLRTFFIDRYRDKAAGAEGQNVRWVTRRALFDQALLAADRPLTVAINLPFHYRFTSPVAGEREVPAFLDGLDDVLASDVRLLCLRAPKLNDDAYARLARLVAARCQSAGVELMLHGAAERGPLVRECGARGLHLTANSAATVNARPVDDGAWLAVSVQTATDLQHAHALGADFSTLACILPDKDGPDESAPGWPGFAALVRDALLPVYACGPLRPAAEAQARAQGGQGVATAFS